MTEEEYVAIGKFGGVRGVRGEIYVVPYSGDPQRIKRLTRAFIKIDARFAELKIVKISVYSGKTAVKLEAYDKPEDSRPLTNRELYVTKKQLGKLPDGEYYAYQLEGSKVELADGEIVGSLVSIENYPSSDVYVIEDSRGKKFRLPAVSEFVRSVDVEDKRIVIAPPEGWREIAD